MKSLKIINTYIQFYELHMCITPILKFPPIVDAFICGKIQIIKSPNIFTFLTIHFPQLQAKQPYTL